MTEPAITEDTMDEEFRNSTDDNVTLSWNATPLPRENSPMSGDPLYVCNLYNFVMTGVVQLVVSCIGFVGNVLSAIVFWPVNNEAMTATAFLLICLAVLDNIMLALYYLLLGVTNTCIFFDTCHYYMKNAYPYVNVWLFPIATTSHLAEVWTVTVVTLHRYIAVCLPHRVAKFANLRVARLQMFAVISLSILFNIPRCLDDRVVTRSGGSPRRVRTQLGNDDTFKLLYTGLFYYVVIYVLPVVFLAAMTYRRLIAAFHFLF